MKDSWVQRLVKIEARSLHNLILVSIDCNFFSVLNLISLLAILNQNKLFDIVLSFAKYSVKRYFPVFTTKFSLF